MNNIPHVGELPLNIIAEVVAHGDKAVAAIDKAEKKVTKNKDEFLRLKNDIYSYREFAYFFNSKVKAAEHVLDYQYTKDVSDLEKAIPLMEKSLDHYRKLVDLTKDTYLYANSMQTAQRRIPIGGDDGKNKTWLELLPHYEKELENFKENLAILESDDKKSAVAADELIPAELSVSGTSGKWISLSEGLEIIEGEDSKVEDVAQELKKMKVYKVNGENQKKNGTTLTFETKEPVKLLVGFFRNDQSAYAKAPTLETDASANLYGQADPVLINAIKLSGQPAVNIHTYNFAAGKHTLSIGRGMCLILGFSTSDITSRNVGLVEDESSEHVDWLFY
jgi:hypothetical protein